MLHHLHTYLPPRCDTTLSQQLTSGLIYFSDSLFKCKLTAMRSLQYCCLLIPVKNRELLQMLLKFMVKLMDNHVISLSDELPTKEMVREWCIARTEHLALKFTRLSLKLVLSCKHKKSKILPVFIST